MVEIDDGQRQPKSDDREEIFRSSSNLCLDSPKMGGSFQPLHQDEPGVSNSMWETQLSTQQIQLSNHLTDRSPSQLSKLIDARLVGPVQASGSIVMDFWAILILVIDFIFI